jgi:hypothetical protein
MATYGVTLRVVPDDRQLQRDPPESFADVDRHVAADDLALDGEILKSIGEFNSIDLGIATEGMVGNAVNAFGSLNGMGYSSFDAPVADTVRQTDNWIGTVRRLDERTESSSRGGSSIRGTASERANRFVVDTIVADDLLYVFVRGSGDSPGGDRGALRITLADGRALPDWFSVTRDGVAVAQPPTGLGFIDIRIQADRDGRIVDERLRIDLTTGTIIDHNPDRQGSIESGLFSDRLCAELSGRDREASTLSHALRNWSDTGYHP